MAIPYGKAAMQLLFNWTPRLSWYKELRKIRTRIVDAHTLRNEILSGGIVTVGASIDNDELYVDFNGMSCMLKGRLKAAIAAFVDTDLLVTAGDIEQPIYSDGADATGFDLVDDSEDVAYCTLIVTNSDGDGTVTDTDNSSPKLVLVVNGTSTTWDAQTAYCTSSEIQAALEASTDIHDSADLVWAHVCNILFDENDQSPTITVTMNRNNFSDQ